MSVFRKLDLLESFYHLQEVDCKCNVVRIFKLTNIRPEIYFDGRLLGGIFSKSPSICALMIGPSEGDNGWMVYLCAILEKWGTTVRILPTAAMQDSA